MIKKESAVIKESPAYKAWELEQKEPQPAHIGRRKILASHPSLTVDSELAHLIMYHGNLVERGKISHPPMGIKAYFAKVERVEERIEELLQLQREEVPSNETRG